MNQGHFNLVTFIWVKFGNISSDIQIDNTSSFISQMTYLHTNFHIFNEVI